MSLSFSSAWDRSQSTPIALLQKLSIPGQKTSENSYKPLPPSTQRSMCFVCGVRHSLRHSFCFCVSAKNLHLYIYTWLLGCVFIILSNCYPIVLSHFASCNVKLIFFASDFTILLFLFSLTAITINISAYHSRKEGS